MGVSCCLHDAPLFVKSCCPQASLAAGSSMLVDVGRTFDARMEGDASTMGDACMEEDECAEELLAAAWSCWPQSMLLAAARAAAHHLHGVVPAAGTSLVKPLPAASSARTMECPLHEETKLKGSCRSYQLAAH
ncbi:hypothetical protein Dimus_018250, partial [Dionaea muscipula]